MSEQHKGLTPTGLELWGGVECTVNRVGEQYIDQLECNGHAWRVSDLDLFAELGVRTLRYPVIWERTAPREDGTADWSWPDERLARLQQLDITPIIGLVHHGSGPRHTSLVDPQFPDKLAAYARAVAERYPWIVNYTPVNEPLTTARFSGLYGHWFPHGRDDVTFARALLTECRATVLAMHAIRTVTPVARLVQTEDMGKVFSTPRLAYQAEFENHRRWLSFDLLCGHVDASHPMWDYLRGLGIGEEELVAFLESPCPPDVIGLNYYITSERFLDERIRRYPTELHGGNGRHKYADIAAVRVCEDGTAGPRAIIEEAWHRYSLPVAITEAHLGCTREEQLRWLVEVWNAARAARRNGVDVRAVTAWSLLGAYDWDSLVTRSRGNYEPGVYDLRGGHPRPTALADLLKHLAAGQEYSHPVLSMPGWWHRSERVLYPPVHRDTGRGDCPAQDQTLEMKPTTQPRSTVPALAERISRPQAHPVVITGANGTLGRAFARICGARAIPYRLLSRSDMDIADSESVTRALDRIQPWAVINTAGYVRVDEAEREPEACFRENTLGPATLAAGCACDNVALLTFSSDLVFDGRRREPYVESDHTVPLNVYGRSKAEAEARVLDTYSKALIVRTSAFFGPWDQYNFVTMALRSLLETRSFVAADDAVISPTYVPDLTNACLDLLIDGESGLWHMANQGAVTWAELARHAADLAEISYRGIEPRPSHSLGLVAPRPLYSVLGTERCALLPPLTDSLCRYLKAIEQEEHHPLRERRQIRVA